MTDVLTVATGLAVGVLSGLIGIGGGVLLVPIMVLGFGFDQHLAQGTSLAAILPTSLVGALTHYRQGNLELRGATWMGLTGAALAAGASIVALHLHAQLLARIFGLLLLFAAYRLWRPQAARERQGAAGRDR